MSKTLRFLCRASCALIFLGDIVLAQPGSGAATPPAGNASAAPAAVRSPEVMSDGRVTFRLRAPNAREVSMQPEPGKTMPMVKGDDGVWSVTVGPWTPDVYAYRFVVDGVNMPDPAYGGPLKTSRPNAAGEVGPLSGWQSMVVVPNPTKPEPWEMTAVPHGMTTHAEFWSKTMAAFRDYYVYTPPGYDAKRAQPYPVLYLLHGAGENATGWINNGKANLILDNLIAEGKVVPMIVVMPLGHPAQEVRPGFAVSGEKSGTTPVAGAAQGAGGNNTALFGSLINEIMPQVEKSFNAGTTKALRAIAGLSMGGGQTFNLALAYPEKFTYVGMFSSAVGGGGRGAAPATTAPAAPATPAPYVLPDRATAEWGKQFKLLWIACGKDDRLFAPNASLKAALKEKGIKHEDIVTEGAHSFSVWKRNLVAFTPLLFR